MELTYRYVLTREFSPLYRRNMLFVMLNPSTADETNDDPTIIRCMNFARREMMGSLSVVNLYAMRATDPAELQKALALGLDAAGPDNLSFITNEVAVADRIVVAWGANGRPGANRTKVLGRMSHRKLECLGTTKDGSPRHPLYVRGDQPLIPWVPR